MGSWFNLLKSIVCPVMALVHLCPRFHVGSHITITLAQLLNWKMQHRDEVAMEDKMLTRDRPENDFISRLLLHYFLFSYIYLFIYLFFQFVAIVFVLFCFFYC